MAHDTSTVEGWLATFADELGGQPPTAEELRDLLDVARHAAHRSERRAAPIATWIAGRSGRPVAEVLALVEANPRLCEPGEDADAVPDAPEGDTVAGQVDVSSSGVASSAGPAAASARPAAPSSAGPADAAASAPLTDVPPAAQPGPPER